MFFFLVVVFCVDLSVLGFNLGDNLQLTPPKKKIKIKKKKKKIKKKKKKKKQRQG